MSQTVANASLRWKIHRTGDHTQVALAGEIDEHSALERLVPHLEGPVVLDAHDVTRINSIGVRKWVNFMRDMQPRCQIGLSRCSPAMVAQLNSVANFRGAAFVQSVVAPYFCGRCDREQMELISIVAETSPHRLVQGDHYCKACGSELEFDDLPERYFVFLSGSGV